MKIGLKQLLIGGGQAPPSPEQVPLKEQPIWRGRVFQVKFKVNGFVRTVDCYEHTTIGQALSSVIKGLKLSGKGEFDINSARNLRRISGPLATHSPLSMDACPVPGSVYSVSVQKAPKFKLFPLGKSKSQGARISGR